MEQSINIMEIECYSRQTTDRYEAVADYRLMEVRSPLDDLDRGIELEKELIRRAVLNTKKVFNH